MNCILCFKEPATKSATLVDREAYFCNQCYELYITEVGVARMTGEPTNHNHAWLAARRKYIWISTRSTSKPISTPSTA